MNPTRKLEKLKIPHTFKPKGSDREYTYDYKLTLDCGHARYLNHSGSDTFLTSWQDAETMYCKKCRRSIAEMNRQIEDADDRLFTDWNY